MSLSNKTFLFFLKCPSLENLVCFSVDVPYEDQGNGLSLFHRRILKCRQLIFSEADIVATPEHFSKSQITAVIPKGKFYSSEFKQKLETMGLNLVKIGDSSPRVLQECLQYTVVARLAPQWNSVQNLLVQGRDFLTVTGPLKAIKLDVFVTDSEISLCVTPTCVKLPHFKIENFVNMNEMSRTSFSMDQKFHVLPSLKKGKAVSLSKSMLRTSMFKNYLDIKKHWKNMYGYRLPDIPEENIWYVNIEFHVPYSIPLSYPYYCVRPFEMTEVPRVDPQLTLRSFVTDFCKKMDNICKEKCQILDLKASFPLLQLYTAADVIQLTAPKIGTTYTMAQNLPYRSYSVTRTSDASQTIKRQNGSSSLKKLPQNYVKICKNDRSLSHETPFRNMTVETPDTIHGNPLSCTDADKTIEKPILAQNWQSNQSLKDNTRQVNGEKIDNNFRHGNTVDTPNLICFKKLKTGDSNMILNDYKNTSTPIYNRGTDISQTKSESNLLQRYVPTFFSKKPKQPMKTLPEMFSKIKSLKNPNKVPLVNALFDTKQKSVESDFASTQDFLIFSGETNFSAITANSKLSKRNSFNVTGEIKSSPRNSEMKSYSRKRKGNSDNVLESSKSKTRKCSVPTPKRAAKKSTKC